MKYYIISGETSGDQHASHVISELNKLDMNAEFRGMGGDQSQNAGQDLLLHQKEMAIMGFWEVLKNLRKIARNLSLVKQDILAWKPDAVILVDYPGFNFKIAKFASEHNIPVHYYISPKVWAWKESRVELIRKYVTKLYSILPFEKEFFKARNVGSIYVGNPSKEAVDNYLQANPSTSSDQTIALLPGSRAQEISTALPVMLEAVKEYQNYSILIAQAPGFDASFYSQFGEDFELIKGDMYGLLNRSKVALVTSGTATLETALMGVPQVVCYKMSPITYAIGKRLVKSKYISLVNLILDKACITELIQHDFNPERLRTEMKTLIQESDERSLMLNEYKKLRAILGDIKPSNQVASQIFNSLN